MLERHIEQRVVKWARQHMRVKKMNGLGDRSWPDRMFMIPGGKPFFIEFKRPGNKPTPLQEHTIRGLKEHGYDVEVHDDSDQAIRAIRARLDTKGPPFKRDEVLARKRRSWASS
jgi:hypothetical protein